MSDTTTAAETPDQALARALNAAKLRRVGVHAQTVMQQDYRYHIQAPAGADDSEPSR